MAKAVVCTGICDKSGPVWLNGEELVCWDCHPPPIDDDPEPQLRPADAVNVMSRAAWEADFGPIDIKAIDAGLKAWASQWPVSGTPIKRLGYSPVWPERSEPTATAPARPDTEGMNGDVGASKNVGQKGE